jgi:hypothetical protein
VTKHVNIADDGVDDDDDNGVLVTSLWHGKSVMLMAEEKGHEDTAL